MSHSAVMCYRASVLQSALAALLVLVACSGDKGRAAPAAPPPTITVAIAFAGAGPEEIEQLVAMPIEAALNRVTGMRSIRTTIHRGHAAIAVELEDERHRDAALGDIQRRLGDVRRQLPEAAGPPVISSVALDARPALWLELSGPAAAVELSELARDQIVPALQRLPGVGRVDLLHELRRTVEVRLDPRRLAATATTAAEVMSALRASNVGLPAGALTSGGATITVRSTLDLASLQTLVVHAREATPVRLADLASIELSVERVEPDPGTPPAGSPGRETPVIAVRLQPGAAADDVVPTLRASAAALRRTLPDGFTLAVVPAPTGAAPRPPGLTVSLRGPDWPTLAALAGKLERGLRATGLVQEVTSDHVVGAPETTVAPDRARAADLGVTSAEIAATLGAVDGAPVGELLDRDRRVPVVVRIGPPGSTLDNHLARLHVRSRTGALVPLSAVVTTATAASPAALVRVDRDRAVTLSATVAPGGSLARVRAAVDDLLGDLLPGYRAIVSP